MSDALPYRLATAYVPTDCDLDLTPDIPARTFVGTETLTFVKNSDSPFADLFADKTITVNSVSQSGAPLTFTHVGDRFRIFGTALDSAPVTISYAGSLDQNAYGWYYINDNCTATLFEATHARACFPAFDEPSQKTTFKLTLTIKKSLTAASNMPIESIVVNGDLKSVTFQRTPRICAYLFAFAIGQFDFLNGTTARGLPIDVFALPGKADLMPFALQEAISVVEWYENFFNFQYPLPRLQLLSVPNFNAGGMENFGLIIFREECLLAKPGVTSIRIIRSVARIIAHEIAHQWCGNMVSPKFWDSLWLNEGFATVLPYLAFAEIHPDWKSWEDFQQADFKSALLADDVATSHPIQQKVERDGQIEGLFDSISYSKSGCMIRMLYEKLGREAFRKGMNAYFTEFMHSNADTADICRCFSRALGVDFEPFFKAWTTQNNYPIAILEDDGTLYQRHFTRSAILDDRFWPLPLVIGFSKNGEIQERTIELGPEPIKLDIDCDWLKINKECRSFCRVWQKGRYFTQLLSAVRQKQIGNADRWALLVDYRSLSQTGLVSSADVLTLLESYPDEDDHLVGTEIAGAFIYLMNLFSESKPKIAVIARAVLLKILVNIGREPGPDEEAGVKSLRNSLLSTLIFYLQDAETIEYGKSLWARFIADRSSIDTNVLPIALRAGARFCNAYDVLLQQAQSDPHSEVKTGSMVALGFSPIERLDEVLRFGQAAPVQDVIRYFVGVALNPESNRMFYDFLIANWADIDARFGTLPFNIQLFIEHATSVMKTPEDADALEQFFREHPCDIATHTVQECAERIRNRAAVIARDKQGVADFLG
jgi:puromycin-sensitive aminopeptidase